MLPLARSRTKPTTAGLTGFGARMQPTISETCGPREHVDSTGLSCLRTFVAIREADIFHFLVRSASCDEARLPLQFGYVLTMVIVLLVAGVSITLREERALSQMDATGEGRNLLAQGRGRHAHRRCCRGDLRFASTPSPPRARWRLHQLGLNLSFQADHTGVKENRGTSLPNRARMGGVQRVGRRSRLGCKAVQWYSSLAE